jgi:hypothetical protein
MVNRRIEMNDDLAVRIGEVIIRVGDLVGYEGSEASSVIEGIDPYRNCLIIKVPEAGTTMEIPLNLWAGARIINITSENQSDPNYAFRNKG